MFLILFVIHINKSSYYLNYGFQVQKRILSSSTEMRAKINLNFLGA